MIKFKSRFCFFAACCTKKNKCLKIGNLNEEMKKQRIQDRNNANHTSDNYQMICLHTHTHTHNTNKRKNWRAINSMQKMSSPISINYLNLHEAHFCFNHINFRQTKTKQTNTKIKVKNNRR